MVMYLFTMTGISKFCPKNMKHLSSNIIEIPVDVSICISFFEDKIGKNTGA